jgi:hypothetical protein
VTSTLRLSRTPLFPEIYEEVDESVLGR